MKLSALSIVLVACLAATAGRAAALPSGALLVRIPVDAPAAPTLEKDVRAALEPKIRLLDRARTQQLVDEAQQFGLSCVQLDDACATGFAALVKVDDVITVTVERLAGAWWVRAARVSSSGKPPMRLAGRIAEQPDDGGQPAAALVAGLYGTPAFAQVPVRIAVDPSDAVVRVDDKAVVRIDGIAWVLPGTRTFEARARGSRASTQLEVRPDGELLTVSLVVDPPAAPPAVATTPPAPSAPPPAAPAPPPTRVDEGGSPLPLAATITGAVIGVGGAVVWIAMDALLGGPIDSRAERDNIEAAGIAGVVAVGLGAVVAGTGAVLLAVE